MFNQYRAASEKTSTEPQYSSEQGKHLLLELAGCNQKALNDLAHIKSVLTVAAELAGATVLNSVFHQFTPQGVTGALILAESHITAHSYPEHGRISIDMFTCGKKCSPENVIDFLIASFEAKSHDDMLLQRCMGLKVLGPQGSPILKSQQPEEAPFPLRL